jgi:hypothetical protein
MIALGGIIVRQSILIVEFVKLEVAKGNEVREAAIKGAELRMRPIFITSLTLMAGAFAILQDPIFNGMAISLLFGAGVATVMALLVIPLGCISARRQFYVHTSDDGTVSVSPLYERIEKVKSEEAAPAVYKTPLWMRIYGGVISGVTWIYYIVRAMFTMLGMGFKAIFGRFGGGKSTPPPPREPPPAGGTPPPPAGGTPPPAPAAEPATPPAAGSATQPTPAAGKAEPQPAATAAAEPAPAPEPAPVPPPQASAAAEPAPAPEPAPVPPPQASTTLEVDEPGDDSAEIGTEEEEAEGVSRKRRGIRLKQDLR